MNLLILGGTTEASALARALVVDGRFRPTLSLAGRTTRPVQQPIPVRTGGFGGPDGLAAYLLAHRIGCLVDATHPFAAQITRHAVAAASRAAIPLLLVRRPEWQPMHGDRWTGVPGMEEAVAALGTRPRRVLLTIGRQDLAPFAAAPWHDYVIRAIEPPPARCLPPRCRVIAARGPFAEPDERCLLQAHRIETIVAKNSGGTATSAKLAAARALGIGLVMVARPAPPPGIPHVATAAEALAWLAAQHAATLRGA